MGAVLFAPMTTPHYPPIPPDPPWPPEHTPFRPRPHPEPDEERAGKPRCDYDAVEAIVKRAFGIPAPPPERPPPDTSLFVDRLRAVRDDPSLFDELAADLTHHTVADAAVLKAIREVFGIVAMAAVTRISPKKRMEWLRLNVVGG